VGSGVAGGAAGIAASSGGGAFELGEAAASGELVGSLIASHQVTVIARPTPAILSRVVGLVCPERWRCTLDL
jgi:hypothetical protein